MLMVSIENSQVRKKHKPEKATIKKLQIKKNLKMLYQVEIASEIIRVNLY